MPCLLCLQQAHGEIHELRSAVQQLGAQLQECDSSLRGAGRERDELKHAAASAVELRKQVRRMYRLTATHVVFYHTRLPRTDQQGLNFPAVECT